MYLAYRSWDCPDRFPLVSLYRVPAYLRQRLRRTPRLGGHPAAHRRRAGVYLLPVRMGADDPVAQGNFRAFVLSDLRFDLLNRCEGAIGGEGRRSGGRHPRAKWGKFAKGVASVK